MNTLAKPLLKKTYALFSRCFVISALSVNLTQSGAAYAQPTFSLTGGATLTSASQQTQAQGESGQDDAEDETSLAAVKKSRLAAIKLPQGAFLFTGKKQTGSLIEALEKFAEQNRVTPGAKEVLVWQNGDSVQKDFPALCEEAGYQYKAQPALESEEGKITLFTCVPEQKDSKKNRLFGFWGTNGRTLVLTWTVVKSDDKSAKSETETPEVLPVSHPTATGKVAAKETTRPALEASNGKTPADLLGEWSWTTISSVNYQNTTTHQLAAPSGMSCRFTFTRDGRYKKFFYVRMRTYSLVTESTTTEEGTVTFGDSTFTLHPEKGYYKGSTGSRIIDRPMTKEERKATTYSWEWRKQEGGRRLFLGPNTQSLSLFTVAK